MVSVSSVFDPMTEDSFDGQATFANTQVDASKGRVKIHVDYW